MEQIYYGIAVFVYALFIIRFILSWVGGDFDIDDTDLDLNDVVSFKGLTHFLMGASGWLSVKSLITHNIMWYDYLIAFGLGIIFVIILFFVYKFLITLESKPKILNGEEFVGSVATVYLKIGKDEHNINKYIIITQNGGGIVELQAKSVAEFDIGDSVKIMDYVDAYYII